MITKEGIRLLEILKTNEELKKKIEELKFGCVFIFGGKTFKILSHRKKNLVNNCFISEDLNKGDLERIFLNNHCKIIGQATFIDLLFFLKNCYIQNNGYLVKQHFCNITYQEGSESILCFDNTKEVLEQDEKVLKKLNDWLIKEFKIDIK